MIIQRLAAFVSGVLLLLPLGAFAQGGGETKKHHTPFSYEFDIGGATPTGASGNSYSPSFMVGGGASLPIGRWVSIDWASMDFGFGTTGASQNISVSDGSTRQTKNYQMMFGSGGRVNLPLGRSAALGLGGGIGVIAQNEYVPDRVYYSGGVRVIESVDCTSCTRQSFYGPYIEARLFGRPDKYSGFGVKAKYYMVKDGDHSAGSFLRLPNQRWLTVGVTFSFGI